MRVIHNIIVQMTSVTVTALKLFYMNVKDLSTRIKMPYTRKNDVIHLLRVHQ